MSRPPARPPARPAARAAQRGPAPRSAPRPATRPRARPPARRTTRRSRALGRPGLRLRGGLVVLAALVLVLGGRLVWLQGLQPAAYAERAGVQRTQQIALAAQRGDVVDRNGNPLAVSVLAKNVYAEPSLLRRAGCQAASAAPCDPHEIAARVAPLLGLETARVEEKLRSDHDFVYLKRGVDTTVAQRVLDLDLPGIGTESTSRRVHPADDLASGVLGFTDRDGAGKMGVELAYDDVLSGVPGEVLAQFDAFGRVIPTGSDRRREPVPGKDVVLTLDRDLQWYAQRLIADQVAATHAKNGTVVVMDVRTGELLALATAPTFHPDRLTAADSERLTNPAISDVFEPGSVNKVVTAAAALQAHVVTPLSVVEVPPTYRVGNHTLHDAEKHGHERLTFAGVLAKSSNIGTVKVAQRVGPQRLYDMMRAFGFGEKTGVELPGESRGLLPRPADWSVTSIGTIPIGQGVSVSALQAASVYATIANGGVRVTPTVVKAVRDNAGHLAPVPAPTSHRVVTAEVAGQIRAMLESVVSEQGTAPKAAIPGYRVAGKTGTAQRVAVSGPRQGRYDGTYTSSFIGMAPADAPRFVTAVVLQGTGSRGYFGGQVAAPLFSQVMGFALRSYDVAPTGTRPHPFRLEASD
ncbi:MAG TPA: penicillin-binding protein 2 [Mycobacteriales bacterium]|nr:penicillin-binding protein 2 [Mycobacteriales bacterium]